MARRKIQRRHTNLMRFQEIFEAEPASPQKPLTPEQARARAEKISRARATVNDVRAANALRLTVAAKKAAAAAT